MELQKTLKFLEHFSIITIGDNKVPNCAWKEQQSQKLSVDQFTRNFNLPTTKGFGICTGFEDLECVDVDLKVFSTAQEQREFWGEYLQNLRDNILDFDYKVAVYKTKNAGYHLLYKTKRVQGNLKLAKLEGHNEAVIETRGIGGYIFAYPENQASKLSYFDIQYISDQDREIIMHFSKMYNHIEIEEAPVTIKIKTEYNGENTPPWEDYNNKTDILDLLLQDGEFTIPPHGHKAKHILVKRFGSKSAFSGYVFKNSGCLYLWSTATQYPHQKLLTPFIVLAYKNYHGDFSECAKELYKQGYGDRVQKKVKEAEKSLHDVSEYNIENIEFPIDIYPKPLQSYLMECYEKLDSNIDYTGSALLWLTSVCVGNAFELEVKRGWTENGSVWIALVGKAGIGKTPSINKIIYPLEKININEIKKFSKELEKWEEYDSLSKKDKDQVSEVEKPKKTQFIANDITMEALVDLHQESDNAVGVFKDELAGWFKDQNKYNKGSDLEFWLSAWSGKPVYLNRKTSRSSYVDKPFIPVLGGIQPGILSNFYTEENKDSGFMDRMLLSFPDATVEKYNENELSEGVFEWYTDCMTMFFNDIKRRINYNDDGTIKPMKVMLNEEAKQEWVKVFNEITDFQNSDEENEYLKSMYPKQKSYIPRFALLLHLLEAHFNPETDFRYVNKESMQKAIKLSKYFINNAKKVRIDSVIVNDIKKVVKSSSNNTEVIKMMYEQNPEFNRSKLAETLGVSRQHVINVIKNLGVNKV